MVKTIVAGDQAPNFQLPATGAETIRLEDFRGKNLVLFFYPKADTPGCTRESIEFSQARQSFESCNTAVLGISGDSMKAQNAFQSKYALTMPLLSDENHAMLGAYGVWSEKSMYGKKYMGIERSTFLIDRTGRIAQIWRQVKVPGHAAEVLQAARNLSK